MGVVEIKVEGMVNVKVMIKLLEKVELDDDPVGVLIDALEVRDYEAPSTGVLVQWLNDRENIEKVAILTRDSALQMIVSTMASMTKATMIPLDQREAAEAWLNR